MPEIVRRVTFDIAEMNQPADQRAVIVADAVSSLIRGQVIDNGENRLDASVKGALVVERGFLNNYQERVTNVVAKVVDGEPMGHADNLVGYNALSDSSVTRHILGAAQSIGIEFVFPADHTITPL